MCFINKKYPLLVMTFQQSVENEILSSSQTLLIPLWLRR